MIFFKICDKIVKDKIVKEYTKIGDAYKYEL